MNLSLGGSTHSTLSTHLNTNRSKIIRPAKTIQTESTHLVQKQAVWNAWDGNRILQDYNGKHVFTTVYEADSFVPLARLVWLDDQLTQAANDEILSTASIEKLDQLKQIALQNIGELEGLDPTQTTIPHAANDEPSKHSKYQVYWYQNDHLGTPRELTEKTGEIAWEAVYQAWGNTVTVEWQEVAQAQELNPIQLNATEQNYLLQPYRFQGQIYDVETGLHYNRFRYYDPDAGRFISHDPIGLLGGDNNFQYAPNPVGWVDPLGLAKGKKPGGYEIHDVDGHGRLSPQKNRKPGNCNLEEDDFIQSHHPVQQEWGKLQTFPNGKYSPTKAPAILLPSKSGMSHATISSMQRQFRRTNGYNTTARQEMMEAAKQLRVAGVPQKAAKKALSRTYKYLDSLGAFK